MAPIIKKYEYPRELWPEESKGYATLRVSWTEKLSASDACWTPHRINVMAPDRAVRVFQVYNPGALKISQIKSGGLE